MPITQAVTLALPLAQTNPKPLQSGSPPVPAACPCPGVQCTPLQDSLTSVLAAANWDPEDVNLVASLMFDPKNPNRWHSDGQGGAGV